MSPSSPGKSLDDSFARLHELCERRKKESLEVPCQWPPLGRKAILAEYKGHQLAVVNGHSALCGYIALPRDHQYFCKYYDDIPVDVHGGWTFCQLGADGNFWIGFDTAHLSSGTWTVDQVITELHKAMDALWPEQVAQ